MTPAMILATLLNMPHVHTSDLPDDQRGIYGLIDHTGQLRYIGSTSALNENFRKRIHQRHRTGSETYSHYLSKIYNTGRMWRCRLTQQGHADAKLAKDLRSRFIAEYCRAVYVPLDGSKAEIERLEAAVIALAPAECTLWNGSTNLSYEEPVALVDALIERMGYGAEDLLALGRQRTRFLKLG